MKKVLTLLFILISTYLQSQEYISNFSEIYEYDSLTNNYILKDSSYDAVEILIIDNEIIISQKIPSKPLCLNCIFSINNKDFNEEEQTYYYFVEELNRNYRIEYNLSESTIGLILENQYAICYYVDKKP